MKTHYTVIENWYNRKKNRDGEVKWRGHSIRSDGRYLYSETLSYPLAIRLNKSRMFMVNADQPSNNTFHAWEVTRVLDRLIKNRDRIIVFPFTPLMEAGINLSKLRGRNILDHKKSTSWLSLARRSDGKAYAFPASTEDTQLHFYRDLNDEVLTGKGSDGKPRVGRCNNLVSVAGLAQYHTDSYSSIITYLFPEEFDYDTHAVGVFHKKAYNEVITLVYYDGTSEAMKILGQWRQPDAVLIQQNGKRYLGSMDESSFFVSLLAGKPNTITGAFRDLQPPIVRRVQKLGGFMVKRQGEWFFIETDRTNKELARRANCLVKDLDIRQHALEPKQSPYSNDHVVVSAKIGDRYFCKGVVYHRDPYTGLSTGEHSPLNLGLKWWLAVKNTSRGDWSATGRLD